MAKLVKDFAPAVQTREAEAHRRGRPRAVVPSTAVSTWLEAPYHDRLIAAAKRERTSLSSLIRELLILRIP